MVCLYLILFCVSRCILIQMEQTVLKEDISKWEHWGIRCDCVATANGYMADGSGRRAP